MNQNIEPLPAIKSTTSVNNDISKPAGWKKFDIGITTKN